MKTTSESSPTSQEPDGPASTAVLELGKLLAAALEQTDTLGRWIAHYLAERMTSLEQKNGSERDTAEAEVADLILRLWSLRRRLPSDRLPLAAVDEVEAAIERLTPGRRPWAYFGAFATDTEPSTEKTETNDALKAALLVDRLAGDLVHGLISLAATRSEEYDADWITQANKIGDGALWTVRRVRSADDDSDLPAARKWESEVRSRATELSAVISDLIAVVESERSDPPKETSG